MATFEMLGKTWELRLDAPTLQRLRTDSTLTVNVARDGTITQTPIDLTDVTGEVIAALEDDIVCLVRVLAFLCDSQLERHGITPQQFGEGLVGDALDDASEALVQAVLDFFPKRRRAILSAMRRKTDAGVRLAIAKLEDPETDAMLDRLMRRKMTESLERLTQSDSATSLQGKPD